METLNYKTKDTQVKNMLEEFNQLEANILKEGCREPLLYWYDETTKEYILVDGDEGSEDYNITNQKEQEKAVSKVEILPISQKSPIV